MQKFKYKNTVFRKSLPKKRYPKKNPKLDKEQRIISDYKKGMITNTIIITHHIHNNTLKKILKENNIPLREKHKMIDKIKKILEQHDATTIELARLTGLSHDTLKTRQKAWNLPRDKCRCGQGYIYRKIVKSKKN